MTPPERHLIHAKLDVLIARAAHREPVPLDVLVARYELADARESNWPTGLERPSLLGDMAPDEARALAARLIEAADGKEKVGA